jgi:hypothetical protein
MKLGDRPGPFKRALAIGCLAPARFTSVFLHDHVVRIEPFEGVENLLVLQSLIQLTFEFSDVHPRILSQSNS